MRVQRWPQLFHQQIRARKEFKECLEGFPTNLSERLGLHGLSSCKCHSIKTERNEANRYFLCINTTFFLLPGRMIQKCLWVNGIFYIDSPYFKYVDGLEVPWGTRNVLKSSESRSAIQPKSKETFSSKLQQWNFSIHCQSGQALTADKGGLRAL